MKFSHFALANVLGLAFCLYLVTELHQISSSLVKPGIHGLTPESYVKNAHSRQKTELHEGYYQHEYLFRDQVGHDWIWQWSYEQHWAEREIARFGIPSSIYDPYIPNPEELQKRSRIISDGMFFKKGNYINPDFNTMIGHYMEFTAPLYSMLEETSRGKGSQARIETLLKFIQDIPYGIPPDSVDGKSIGGVLPPPLAFQMGWGDCDTKAIIFASILSHDPNAELVFLFVPNHVLLAVESIPRPFQEYIDYQGKRFVIAEPVGPARHDFGHTGKDRYNRFNDVIKINATPQQFEAEVPLIGDNIKAFKDMNQKRLFLVDREQLGETSVEHYNDKRGKDLELVQVERHRNELTIQLKAIKQKRLAANLMREGSEIEGSLFIQPDKSGYLLKAKLSLPGSYQVKVYAKDVDGKGSYPFVFDYSFTNDTRYQGDVIFPTAYNLFGDSEAYLQMPLYGRLEPGAEHFEIRVPGANDVAVIIGEDWTFLEKNGEWFRGDVQVPRSQDQVVVAAQKTGEDNYGFLLVYNEG